MDKSRRQATSIKYEATVSDRTGQRRRFSVPVTLSEKQLAALHDVQGGRKTNEVVQHIVTSAQATILAAADWTCVICEQRATRMVNTPAFYPNHSSGPCVVDLMPLPICQKPSCNQGANRETQEALKAVHYELARENPGHDFLAAQRFTCEFCTSFKTSSSAKLQCCGGCRAVWYCGKACQIAHWKAGHKLVCTPIEVSTVDSAPAPTPCEEAEAADEPPRTAEEAAETLQAAATSAAMRRALLAAIQFAKVPVVATALPRARQRLKELVQTEAKAAEAPECSAPAPATKALPSSTQQPCEVPRRQGREQRHDNTPGNPWATLYSAKAAQLLQEAGQAAQAGEWRECADKYLAAAIEAPRAWDHRWYAFSGFTSLVVREKRFPPTKDDLCALKAFAADAEEPCHFRAEAEFSIGLARWDAHDREGAANYYRKAIERAHAASVQERAAHTCASGRDASGELAIVPKTVGELLDCMAEQARSNLSVLENPVATVARDPTFRADGTEGAQELRTTALPAETERQALKMMLRLRVGGDACDACGQPAQDGALLLKCKRCAMAFYCSAECQKAQWKKGHKAACRAPGQLEPGDDMMLVGLTSRPELNDQIVHVVAPVPAREGRWEVRLCVGGQQQSLCVAAERLTRLRPADVIL